MVICSKAKTCRSAPSCQHGKPHDPKLDCDVRRCFIGGQVHCGKYVVGNGERFGGENGENSDR